MTREEACRILGVSPGAAPDQIKKKYRQLMHRLHPDAGPSEEDLHLAWQVNAAYALLKGTGPGGRIRRLPPQGCPSQSTPKLCPAQRLGRPGQPARLSGAGHPVPR